MMGLPGVPNFVKEGNKDKNKKGQQQPKQTKAQTSLGTDLSTKVKQEQPPPLRLPPVVPGKCCKGITHSSRG
jgi:hypothetical protein